MKLLVDNHDGAGLRDYTSALDAEVLPQVHRRLNTPDEFRFRLQITDPLLAIPRASARVVLAREDASSIFTGYVTAIPDYDFVGWGERGPIYRVAVTAAGDESLLDRRPIPATLAFTNAAAGDVLRSLTQTLLPGAFNLDGVDALDILPAFTPDRGSRWSQLAASLATRARASYRCRGGSITFRPIGAQTHVLSAQSSTFVPAGLSVHTEPPAINDVTVIGPPGPAAYVREYFFADGVGSSFQTTQRAFLRDSAIVLDEQYGSALDAARWNVQDAGGAISVSGSRLRVNGGTGADGETTAALLQPLEIAGALLLAHGSVSFSGASQGVLGGLYEGNISVSNCFAGLAIATSAGPPSISALIGGAIVGTPMTTAGGHTYELYTRIYTPEMSRREQCFHSEAHPSGNPRGGGLVAANSRVVLEVRDVDPANPASLAAPPLVLFDGVVSSPAFAVYGPVNAINMHCDIATTRVTRGPDVEVRAAAPGDPFRTLRVGPVADERDCQLIGGPALQFFARHKPQFQERITVRYRGTAPAISRVADAASAAALSSPGDDGQRAAVVDVLDPAPFTAADCENAARALLDDAVQPRRSGEYSVWSDFLPNGDIMPGDAIALDVPSAGAQFTAVVREVNVAAVDLVNDRYRYQVMFSDDATEPTGMRFVSARSQQLFDVLPRDLTDIMPLPESLPDAEAVSISSGTVTIDVGQPPPAGGGVEVRRLDSGWGTDSASLIGRFATQQFTLPRPAQLSDYFLRAYDGSTPPRFSRYTTAFHIEFPA